jgi:putative holliday junction resolvase
MTSQNSKILGVDLGTKWVGLSIADWQVKIATGFNVIEYKGRVNFIEKLRSIIAEEDIGLIVVGLPKNMDGSEGKKAKEAHELGDLIKNSLNVDMVLIDERLTTVQAIKELHAGEGKVGRSRENINMMAAILILQNYLDSLAFKS